MIFMRASCLDARHVGNLENAPSTNLWPGFGLDGLCGEGACGPTDAVDPDLLRQKAVLLFRLQGLFL